MSDLVLPRVPEGKRMMRCPKGHTFVLPPGINTFNTLQLSPQHRTGPICPECLIKFLQKNVPKMDTSLIVPS